MRSTPKPPYTIRMTLLSLAFCTITATVVSAQSNPSPFALRAGNAEVLTAGSVEVPIYIDVNTTSGASLISFGLLYSETLNLTAVSQGSAISGLNNGAGAFQFLIDTQEASGDPNNNPLTPTGAPNGYKGATVQIQIPDTSLSDFLTLDIDQEIAILHFSEKSNTPGTITSIEFTSLLSGPLGSPIGDVLIEVVDATLPPGSPGNFDESGNPPGVSITNGSVLVIPSPVTNVSCSQIDDCVCLTELSWINAYPYDEIHIFSNEVDPINLITTLAGSDTTYFVTQTDPTEYVIVGLVNGVFSPPVECNNATVCSLTDITPPTIIGVPEDISLVTAEGICSTIVSWIDPTSIDNCDGSITPNYEVTQNGQSVILVNGGLWLSGDYVITYSAIDATGNSTSDNFSVTINAPLGDDCNQNGQHDSCDLNQGIAADCNSNGTPDSCDIADGTEFDCDQDGVPDSCKGGITFDCNNNGIPDECDFLTGNSFDCNGNGILDDCDILNGISEDCDLNGIPDDCEQDTDSDGEIDTCDSDIDGDGISNDCDIDQNPGADCDIDGQIDICQTDTDSDGTIDACDEDLDGDSIPNSCDVDQTAGIDCDLDGQDDSCQIDTDSDGTIDDCDDDIDGDGIPNTCDIDQTSGVDCDSDGQDDDCQFDGDGDGQIDPCDSDLDNDGILNDCDPDHTTGEDCNINGILDDCDIAGGALDDDANGIPDECEETQFIRGDVNGNGGVDISDAVATLDYLFSGGDISCQKSADSNDDSTINVADAIQLLGYLFSGNSDLPLPFPTCGIDPTADSLECEIYNGC